MQRKHYGLPALVERVLLSLTASVKVLAFLFHYYELSHMSTHEPNTFEKASNYILSSLDLSPAGALRQATNRGFS